MITITISICQSGQLAQLSVVVVAPRAIEGAVSEEKSHQRVENEMVQSKSDPH